MRRKPGILKRRGAFRDPRHRIVVVCEGDLTEPSYFYPLARGHNVLVSINSGAGVPLTIVNKTIELKKKK